MNKVILDLCGGTGAWSAPYKEAGYDVRVVDIKNGDDVCLFEYHEPVRGILAAPPCVEFSYAKHFHGEGNYTHDFREGLRVVDACIRIAYSTRSKWWALENPKNYLRRWLGPPDFEFDPWEFGDPYQKRTCVWGAFNIPLTTTDIKPDGIIKFSMLKSKDIYPEYYGKLTRQERRAITPPGFAQAFFEANP